MYTIPLSYPNTKHVAGYCAYYGITYYGDPIFFVLRYFIPKAVPIILYVGELIMFSGTILYVILYSRLQKLK